jgi:hypothetical protein
VAERFGREAIRPASLVGTAPRQVGESNTVPRWD